MAVTKYEEGRVMIGLIIGIVIAFFAFPEVGMYLFLFSSPFFDTSWVSDTPPESLYAFWYLSEPMDLVATSFSGLHIVFKILIYLGIPIVYILLSHFLHIGPIYPLQIFGIGFMIYFTFITLGPSGIFKLDMIWSVTLTIIISLFTLGARLLTFSFLDSLFGGNPYLRERSSRTPNQFVE